jgi:drug/metabolite transporter (DMT)-like permease
MKIAAPELGPVMLILGRAVSGALLIAVVALSLKKRLFLKKHWKHYLFLGLFNSAMPFFFFAYAAKTLPSSMLAILNATSPMWGAVIGAIWTRTAIAPRTVLGLLLGVLGVGLLVGLDGISLTPQVGLAVASVLLASLCYGISTTYANSAAKLDPMANAHGSMWAATLLIVPFAAFFPAPAAPNMAAVGAMLALGIVCTGVAYLLYFRLVQDEGATSALTVTFLVPLFGILWGMLFLSEKIGWQTIAGSAIVIIGTALVTGFRPNLRKHLKLKKARNL